LIDLDLGNVQTEFEIEHVNFILESDATPGARFGLVTVHIQVNQRRHWTIGMVLSLDFLLSVNAIPVFVAEGGYLDTPATDELLMQAVPNGVAYLHVSPHVGLPSAHAMLFSWAYIRLAFSIEVWSVTDDLVFNNMCHIVVFNEDHAYADEISGMITIVNVSWSIVRGLLCISIEYRYDGQNQMDVHGGRHVYMAHFDGLQWRPIRRTDNNQLSHVPLSAPRISYDDPETTYHKSILYHQGIFLYLNVTHEGNAATFELRRDRF
jgi:hypothetical protein